MKLRGFGLSGRRAHNINLRHNFAIGRLCDTYLFDRPARLYYCTRCSWNFLVAGSSVAVIDSEGRPLGGEEAQRRFRSFEGGPCPVLEGLSYELGSAARNGAPVNGSSDRVTGAQNAIPSPQATSFFGAWLRNPGWHRRDARWPG